MDIKIFVVLLSVLHIGLCDEAFELSEFLKNEITSIGWNATWISGDELVYTGEKGDIIRHKFSGDPTKEDTTEVLISGDTLKPYKGATVKFSYDNTLALVKYDVISIFRHSTTARFAIYNLGTKQFSDIANKEHLQICSWSPKENRLAYIFNNDIYYIADATIHSPEERITNDGDPGIIYNGVPDWVYEEEVLGTGSAMWFSPDSKYLVYAKFIDTKVDNFTYIKYGEPGSMDSQYPQVIDIRYPKVGKTNPTFEVHCVNLESEPKNHIRARPTKQLNFLPQGGQSMNYVLNNIIWASDTNVIVYYYTDRQQTGMHWKRCDIESVEDCVMEYNKDLKIGWINIGSPIYKDDGTTALFIESTEQGDDYYPHIIEFERGNGNSLPRTSGAKTVTKIHGWDKTTDSIYYEGTAIGKHWQNHVYSAIIEEGEDPLAIETCLTCDLDTPEGKCTYATAAFSRDLSFYSLICQGPGPTRTSIHKSSDSHMQIWEENNLVRSKLSRKMKPVVEDLTFVFKDENDEDYNVRVRLLLPPQLNKNGGTKYPMVVDVYAGPDSNRISDAFSSGFRNYATTKANYIYAYIDGRGSGLNGNKNMYSIYRKLGTVEIEDQIKAVRKLQTDNNWIDSERTCIWGWSYGGFATAWALVQDVGDENNKPVFACGLSVAPVTNFIYYDSIYTERYMGLPTNDNEVGYKNTDLTSQAEKFAKKNFFLIHGNGDDNVHYQQSMMLARALELKDIPFQTMSYPDENHSLGGVYPHLYHIIDNFFREAFKDDTIDKNGSIIVTKSPFLLTITVLIMSWLYYLR